MCHNNCDFFTFNPIQGTDSCALPSGSVCPDEMIHYYCKHCDEEYQLPEDTEICIICGEDELEIIE